jgi:hypothetical protein
MATEAEALPSSHMEITNKMKLPFNSISQYTINIRTRFWANANGNSEHILATKYEPDRYVPLVFKEKLNKQINNLNEYQIGQEPRGSMHL